MKLLTQPTVSRDQTLISLARPSASTYRKVKYEVHVLNAEYINTGYLPTILFDLYGILYVNSINGKYLRDGVLECLL